MTSGDNDNPRREILGQDVPSQQPVVAPQGTPGPERPSPYTEWAPTRVDRQVGSVIVRPFAVFFHRLKTVLLPSPVPNLKHPVTANDPAGEMSEDHLSVAKEIFDSETVRREKLEEKATGLVSVLSFLTPLVLAMLAYARTQASSNTERYFILVFGGVAIGLLSISFVAALRAVSVQGRQQLHVDSVTDYRDGSVRAFSKDRRARGLLWCGTFNGALNDHLADMVSTSHLFLTLGGLSILVASTALLPGFAEREPESPTAVTGRLAITIEPPAEALRALELRVAAVEAQLKAQQAPDPSVQTAPPQGPVTPPPLEQTPVPY